MLPIPTSDTDRAILREHLEDLLHATEKTSPLDPAAAEAVSAAVTVYLADQHLAPPLPDDYLHLMIYRALRTLHQDEAAARWVEEHLPGQEPLPVFDPDIWPGPVPLLVWQLFASRLVRPARTLTAEGKILWTLDFRRIHQEQAGWLEITLLPGLRALLEQLAPAWDDTSGAGPGSFGHLSMEMLKHQGGFDAQHIAYKGSAPAMNDLLGGQVPVMFSDLVAALPHIKSGKLRALAVGSPRRVDILPDVKTVAEQGFKGFEAVSIGAMMAPKGTPAAAIDRMSSELKAVLALKDVQDRLVGAGCYAHYMTPAETGRYVTAEFDKWGKVIKDNKLTVE